MSWVAPPEKVQFIVVARRPEGWTRPPSWGDRDSGRWNGLRNQLKSIQFHRIAAAIVVGESSAQAAVTTCRNLGLEADYVKVEDVLQ